jgi:hypothetical protein
MNDDLEPVEPEEDILTAKPLIDEDDDGEPLVPGLVPGLVDEPTPLSQLTKGDLDEDEVVEDEDEEDEMELLGAGDWEE